MPIKLQPSFRSVRTWLKNGSERMNMIVHYNVCFIKDLKTKAVQIMSINLNTKISKRKTGNYHLYRQYSLSLTHTFGRTLAHTYIATERERDKHTVPLSSHFLYCFPRCLMLLHSNHNTHWFLCANSSPGRWMFQDGRPVKGQGLKDKKFVWDMHSSFIDRKLRWQQRLASQYLQSVLVACEPSPQHPGCFLSTSRRLGRKPWQFKHGTRLRPDIHELTQK